MTTALIASRRALALAFALTSPVVVAQVDAVEQHVRRGVDLRRAGRDDEARSEFEAAYAQRPEARIAAQLGLACQAAGDWVRADALLREALTATEDRWIARNRAALEGARSVGDRHLATVHLVGSVPGARLRVNGADAGTLPLTAPLRVLAGSVSLEVSAEGFEALTLRFVTAAGETLRERAELRPLPPPPPTPVAAPIPTTVTPTPVAAPTPTTVTPTIVAAPTPTTITPPSPTPWRPLALGAFSGAALLAATGVTTLLLRDGVAADYNQQCDAGDARGPCGDLRDRAVALGAAGWVTLPLGAALAAVGVVLITRGAAPTRVATRASCGLGPASAHCAFSF